MPSVPVPFVVVDKVADKEQPTYGATEPHPLEESDAKRAADFQPDVESTHKETPVDSETPNPTEVPFLVVEKTDNKPAYGDDFGDKATISQKVAHDMRAADARPNKLIITPEDHVEPGTEEEQAAPLFRHESVQLEEPPVKSSSSSALDTIEEGSMDSSADQSSSSKDVFNTPSDSNGSQYEDSFKERSVLRDVDSVREKSELAGPSLSHEVKSVKEEDGELDNGPLLSHETGFNRSLVDDEGEYEEVESAEDVDDELNNGPLLSHETGLNDKTVYPDEDEDEEVDELDLAPLLSHETGFSQYSDKETATNDDISEDAISEPRHFAYDDDDEGNAGRALQSDEAPTFTHEEADIEEDDYDEDDAPLLPHERDSAIASESGTEDDAEPTFPYETTDSRNMYGGVGRPSIFRKRTNSSTLPHRLPRSDEDDENLNDPTLERFPTNREQILQRVATISLQLPEDEFIEEDLRSPGMSVLSQACSSVDLAAVKSYTSLASVPEASDSDEDEDDADLESMPNSPMVMHMARGVRDFASDPQVTPMAGEEKKIGDGESGGKTSVSILNDDAETRELDQVDETPAKILTPPLSPAPASTSTDQGELRHRNIPKPDAPVSETESSGGAITTSPHPQQLDQQPNETFLQNFLRVVFGSLGRFLTACVGDRKRAG
ncbi:MAG: hypothetical protein I4N50_13885 [Rhizobium sp.]|nr:hypothetical protein [Rhizobium sp.]